MYIYIYIYLIWSHGHNSNGSLGKWPSHHLAAHGTTTGLLTSACSSPSNLKALRGLWFGKKSWEIVEVFHLRSYCHQQWQKCSHGLVPLCWPPSNMTRWLGPCLASHQLHEMSTSCHQMWKAGDFFFSRHTACNRMSSMTNTRNLSYSKLSKSVSVRIIIILVQNLDAKSTSRCGIQMIVVQPATDHKEPTLSVKIVRLSTSHR